MTSLVRIFTTSDSRFSELKSISSCKSQRQRNARFTNGVNSNSIDQEEDTKQILW